MKGIITEILKYLSDSHKENHKVIIRTWMVYKDDAPTDPPVKGKPIAHTITFTCQNFPSYEYDIVIMGGKITGTYNIRYAYRSAYYMNRLLKVGKNQTALFDHKTEKVIAYE